MNNSGLKINNRKNKLKFLNIVAIFLISFVLILYFLPNIITEIKKMDLPDSEPISFSDIGNFLLKLVPFKKGFFSNSNFKFSYITGIVLSIILIIAIIVILYYIFENILLNIISAILMILGFIWINNFVSLFLTHCVIHCFPFLSIAFNLLIYIIIPFIIFIILAFAIVSTD